MFDWCSFLLTFVSPLSPTDHGLLAEIVCIKGDAGHLCSATAGQYSYACCLPMRWSTKGLDDNVVSLLKPEVGSPWSSVAVLLVAPLCGEAVGSDAFQQQACPGSPHVCVALLFLLFLPY